MNQLSWLIYWAGIVNALNSWLTAFAILGFIMCLALTIWACNSDASSGPPKGAFILYPLFLVLLVSSIMVPTRQTILAIAASEMGEKVLATPQAQRVGTALMNWIEDQTKAETPEQSQDHRR